MIEKKARVKEVHDQLAFVVPEEEATCKGCHGACGQSNRWWRWFNRREPGFWIANGIHAKPGDQVVVGIAEEALVQASLLIYFVPLVLLVVAGAAGHWMDTWVFANSSELFTILGGLGGLGAGLFLARHLAHRQRKNSRYQPMVLRYFDFAEKIL